jgi:hypothetical protein
MTLTVRDDRVTVLAKGYTTCSYRSKCRTEASSNETQPIIRGTAYCAALAGRS